MEKRNIVLITFDSLRADHCSFMGYHRKTTPNMDKMAKRGVMFENAIAGSVPTAPSMFCCFTGNYPLLTSMDFSPDNWRNELTKYTTIAQKLSKLGYFTAAFHSNPWVSDIYGFTKGFKVYIDPVVKDLNKKFEFMDPKSKLSRLKRRLDYLSRKHPTTVPWESYYSRLLDLVESLEEPFFLWILLYDTHSLYLPPTKYAKYSKKNILNSIYLLYLYWKAFNRKSLTAPNKCIINAYDDSVRYADMFVGRLLKDLSDFDPVYIIHADHGDGFGEHGFYWHPPKLYEELIHVPLILFNLDVSYKISAPFSLVRLPRLLYDSACGCISLDEYTSDFVFSICKSDGFCVSARGTEWKLIYDDAAHKYELYNILSDPTESCNMYGVNQVDDIFRILSLKLKKFLNTIKLKAASRSLAK